MTRHGIAVYGFERDVRLQRVMDSRQWGIGGGRKMWAPHKCGFFRQTPALCRAF